jgi:hypothetical protein
MRRTRPQPLQSLQGGYNGNGFIGGGGESNQGSNTATVQAFSPPAPTILFNGNPVTGTQSVVVGQQIALTTSVNLPSGVSITQNNWSVPGNTVGGYVNAARNGPPDTTGGQTVAAVLVNSSTTFYWVVPGQPLNVTYSYCVNIPPPNCSPTATATFNATGPTGGPLTATPGTVNVWPASIAFAGATSYPGLELGNSGTNLGMTFQATATPPSTNTGVFQWVQVWNSSTQRYGTLPVVTPNTTYGPGLDNWYPYKTDPGQPNTTNDSPGMNLAAFDSHDAQIPMGEGAESFVATMYLMWDPALPSGCLTASTNPEGQSTPSHCTSIPIPVGNVSWGFGGDAINSLTNQPSTSTTWILNGGCSAPNPAQPQPVTSTTFPQWNNAVHNLL